MLFETVTHTAHSHIIWVICGGLQGQNSWKVWMNSGNNCISSIFFWQGKGHSGSMNLNEPSWIVMNIVIRYWSLCTDRSEWLSCTTASTHEAGRGTSSCSKTLQQSRCLLSWDWLEPKTHRVKTFHPAARWRGVDCCLQQKKKDTAVQFESR